MDKQIRVALIGRVNVGKSALFNRLTSGTRALVSSVAGTTRDRREASCEWLSRSFILIDTGGLNVDPTDVVERKVSEQARRALMDAQLVLFVVDAKVGITAADQRIATVLRISGKPVIVVVNKTDSRRDRDGASEFYRLGFPKLLPVSAVSGVGTGDLLDEIMERIPTRAALPDDRIKLAIVGKPNVGKSSLVNALMGEERTIVHDEPYTTRDANDIPVTVERRKLILIDTAGIRRLQKIDHRSIEWHSASQSRASIKRADVVLLITEAHLPLTSQDKRLAAEIADSNASTVIVGNKWDLVGSKDEAAVAKFTKYYRVSLMALTWAPLIFMSAQEKTKLTILKKTALAAYDERFRKIEKNALNKFLKRLVTRHKPTIGKGTRKPHIYTLQQLDVNPPQFVLRIDYKSDLHSSYIHFVERSLREKFGFEGAPIKLWVEKSRTI